MQAYDKKQLDAKIASSMPVDHPWHNDFHLEMPFGLINDPNGLSFHEGKYHIFMQWNPFGVEHKHKCWSHVETTDFLHYSLPVLALWPTDEHDANGCYSGCGFTEDGELKVLYTCNRREGKTRIPAQRIGTWNGAEIEKGAILIEKEPAGYGSHFRDPARYVKDGREYLLLGGQTADERGRALLYERHGEDAVFLGELRDFGYMWECPNMFSLAGREILLFSPQGLEAEERRYQNLYQSGYVVGELDENTCTYTHGAFEEIDFGFDFYAPQVFQREGRTILYGWMGMPERECEYPTAEYGWMHNLTMPRELTLKDGHIYSRPVREMEALRTGEMRKVEGKIEEVALYKKSEIHLKIPLNEQEKICVKLNYGKEQWCLHYDVQAHIMEIDRNAMELGGRGVRRFALRAEECLCIDAYIDKTAVELFFQDGYCAASFNVFPRSDEVQRLTVTAEHELAEGAAVVFELGGFQWSGK
ncbi:sucrose-6-phosphate hydrolase [Selenomonas sp. TAMA-11512]|uniref:sucrose-6-phosphate hydrolase n=1 Tax=Selenomonas sp. TAMA-11512 TaxID=3095337 RepID=UPI00308D44A4|nr:sucrose-6-phosphate hydrolase [Selenomonas sp. TAMA-11512]